MPICTFFGHRDCCGLDRESLVCAIEDLISRGVDQFYVGHQGQFDGIVRSVLQQLSVKYPHISYQVVLAYLPIEKRDFMDYTNTVYPEGLETCPPKFAISHRNKWMLARAEYCICFINRTWGGAYPYAMQAMRQGKTVINLGKVELGGCP